MLLENDSFVFTLIFSLIHFLTQISVFECFNFVP